MVSFSHKTEHHEDEDLSTILTSEERVDLTLLISNITEVMRKQITDSFDSSIDSENPRETLKSTDKNPNIENQKPHEETEEEKKAKVLREQREKELSAPKMMELKQDCLDFFDKWRESVISRVGNVVNNSKKVIDEQKEKASVKATPKPEVSSEPQVISEFHHSSHNLACIIMIANITARCQHKHRRSRCRINQVIPSNIDIALLFAS